MKTYSVGIIGLSGIAQRPPDGAAHPFFGTALPHSHASGYASCPRTRVKAVCDLVPGLFRQFKDNWGHVWDDVATYTDYREMLAKESLDLISVVTPDHLHADMVVAAVEAGVKGILCEKPIDVTLAAADRMIGAVERHGAVMSVNHSRRWYPEVLQIRNMIAGGDIGQLRLIETTNIYPRAMLFRNGTHKIDMINFFVGSEPRWVWGDLQPEFQSYGTVYAGGGGKDPAIDPGVNAYICYENDVRAQYLAFQGQNSRISETRIIGSEGMIRWWEGEAITLSADGGAERRIKLERTTTSGATAMVEEVIHLIEHGGEGLSPPREARKTLEMILGILQSAANNNCRVDFPVADA